MENATNIDGDLLEENQTAILDYIYMEHHSTLHPFHHNFIDKSQRHGQLQNISQYEQRILPPCEERLTSAKEQVTYQHNRQPEVEGCMKDRNSIKKDLEETVGTVRSPLTDFNRNESFLNGDSSFHVSNSQSENTPHTCDICNRTFARKCTLYLHKKTHTGERPHVCKVCHASFNQKCHLVLHERIHTGERPLVCKVCRTSFNHKYSLVDHERIHTGEKPFVCEECGDSFRLKNTLVRHETIHTGEKRYSCKKCRKLFSQNSSMGSHERICRY